VAIFDAVGHDVGASIVSHVVLGTYRHARRLGNSLSTTATVIDAALARYVGESLFATGLLAQLDCPNGMLRWLGIGHPTPLLLRGGQVSELAGRSSHPLGLGIGDPQPEELQLEPGDQVLFYTDGVIDDRIWAVQEDAVAWLGGRLREAAAAGILRLEEILRELMMATVDRWQGRQGDDATLLLLEWSPS
jgi:serine phosphatase RsbU (regulator of sigma subunit)